MNSRFALKTWTMPRPARADDQYAHLADRELRALQDEWDIAREGDLRLNAANLERVAKRAQEEADRQKRDREREAARQSQAEAPLIERARAAFRAAGGSAEDFEQQRGEIIAQVRARLAVDAAVSAVTPTGTMPVRW